MASVTSLLNRLRALDGPIQDLVAASNAPGLSLGVIHHHDIIHRAHFGYRDVEHRLAPNDDTIYHINSMTKAMTAAAIGVLVEEKKLTWDTPVRKVLPDFRTQSEYLDSITTLRDLCAHQTGVASKDSLWQQDEDELLIEAEDTVPFFNNSPRLGSFRNDFSYNNVAYGILGMVIEKESKQNYGDFLKDRFFDPLKLRRTTAHRVQDKSNIAKAYTTLDDLTFTPIPNNPVCSGSFLAGAAAVKTSLDDMLILYQNWLGAVIEQFENNTTASSGSPFKQCTQQFRGLVGMSTTNYREHSSALGWKRIQLPGPLDTSGLNTAILNHMIEVGGGAPSRLCFYHQGIMPGSNSAVLMFPETRTVIVALQNSLGPSDCTDWVARLLIDNIFDGSKTDYVAMARKASQKYMCRMPAINAELDATRQPGTLKRPLDAFAGQYWNKGHLFCIVVYVQENELWLAFQGRKTQRHRLRHHHDDVFSWQMTHNEASRRGRLVFDHPAGYYLLNFHERDGAICELHWALEKAAQMYDVFTRESREHCQDTNNNSVNL